MATRDRGHQEHSRAATLSCSSRWTVFGPLERPAPAVPAAALAAVPATLKVGRRTLNARTVTAKAGRADLAPLLGGVREGRTAYVFIPVTAPAAGEYRLGLGADWWFAAWLDGRPLGDTLTRGNG